MFLHTDYKYCCVLVGVGQLDEFLKLPGKTFIIFFKVVVMKSEGYTTQRNIVNLLYAIQQQLHSMPLPTSI